MGKKDKIKLDENRQQLIDAMWATNAEGYEKFVKSAANAKYNLAKYFYHTHTDMGSPKDAILTVDQYVETAYAMGAKAIAISDHGTAYAVYPLYYKCRDYGIKLILGVEFYLCDDVEDTSKKKHTRKHLVAYAKNRTGWKTICQLITASNDRIISLPGAKLVYPCISKKLLEEYLAPGTDGHGNVILTSACIGGVLTGISYQASTDAQNLAALEKKYSELKVAIDKYKIASQAIGQLDADIANITPVAKRSFTKVKNYLKKHPDPAAEADLEKQMAETNAAAFKLKELMSTLKQAKKVVKDTQKVLDAAVGHKYAEIEFAERVLHDQERQINELKQEMVEPNEYAAYFEKEALWYDQLAGHGNWFIELQSHGIAAEKQYMPYLVEVARKHDIPLIAANDAHMAKREDAEARKYITALRFNQWEPLGPGDTELYLKDDASLYAALASIVPADAAWEAMKNREVIAEQCSVELNKVDAYPKYSE